MTQDATALARSVVEALIRAGVRDVVLAPGSRNAPLAFALYDARSAGVLRLHTRLDERTAAFLALGFTRGANRPAAVVTTSGTAAANLHPAVLEAAHSALPLLAITADRPARLRGAVTNQTTDQVRLYGEAATFLDLGQEADETLEETLAALRTGPVHLNVLFDEPLVPADTFEPIATAPAEGRRSWRRDGDPIRLEPGPRTVVVAGADAGPEARVLAEAGGWPLLAEPSSGARTGANALRTHRLLLRTRLAPAIERVVLFGSPTLSRPVTRLLGRDGLEVVARSWAGRWSARPHPVALETDRPFLAEAGDPGWFEQWSAADRRLAARIDRWVAGQPGLSPYAVAGAVHGALPPGGLLYVGASNPIRDLDVMARPTPVGERRKIIANRGLAGIDGTLSSAIGAALGRRQPARALAYVGDVTFLHDQGALVIGPDELRPDLSIVVANDDGGSIFATLEQGGPAYAASFEKLFGTPHGTDLASLCAAYRIPHWRADTRAELEQALANPNGGIEVIEARISRSERRALEEELRGLAGS